MPRNDTEIEDLRYYRLRERLARDDDGFVQKDDHHRLEERVALIQKIVFGVVSLILTGVVLAALRFLLTV